MNSTINEMMKQQINYIIQVICWLLNFTMANPPKNILQTTAATSILMIPGLYSVMAWRTEEFAELYQVTLVSK